MYVFISTNDDTVQADPPEHEAEWYAVDFDGTLIESVWPKPGFGEPLWDNLRKLREVYDQGYRVLIFTSRPWPDHQAIEDWLTAHEVRFDMVICGKPLAVKYVDDRAVRADAESWL